jgi:hypothetical protein
MTELYPCSICVLRDYCHRFNLSIDCLALRAYPKFSKGRKIEKSLEKKVDTKSRFC